MVAALAPGGVAVIFDNEADSRFGRRMALRKLVTRYSGLPLVPRYYCNAAYPPLARIPKQHAESAMMVRGIVIWPDGVKRALVEVGGASCREEVCQDDMTRVVDVEE